MMKFKPGDLVYSMFPFISNRKVNSHEESLGIVIKKFGYDSSTAKVLWLDNMNTSCTSDHYLVAPEDPWLIKEREKKNNEV